MAQISRQIGWSQESNLLYQILNQLNKLTSVLFGLKEAALFKNKDITSSVVADVYTITSKDFFKTLVYTGSDDITIEFTSSISYTESESLNILQIGAGQITVAGSGININYTTDVLPISYGANSLMSVLVYTPTTLILSGNLKLA
jgi:hypothetical protein